MAITRVHQLLEDASAGTSEPSAALGNGRYALTVTATDFDGATVALTRFTAQGTEVAIGGEAEFVANGACEVALPYGSVGVSVTGGTPSGLNVELGLIDE